MAVGSRSQDRGHFDPPIRLTLLENDADRMETDASDMQDQIDDLREALAKNSTRNLIFAVSILSSLLVGLIVALLVAHTIAGAHP